MFVPFLVAVFRELVRHVFSYTEHSGTLNRDTIHKGPIMKLDVCAKWRNVQRYARRNVILTTSGDLHYLIQLQKSLRYDMYYCCNVLHCSQS